MDDPLHTLNLKSRYRLDSVIGHGGAGEVLCAWDTQLERTVAVKRLKAQGIHDDTVKAAWQEALRLAAIRHPNIVSVFDIGRDNTDGTTFIVMEYVQGETVDQHASRAAFTLAEFGELARQSLEGIFAAHSAGLIHRDLKPSNIMLARQASGALHVKILDFGIAKFLTGPTTQTINHDGTVTGSIHCISPEQLNLEPVDERTDLYALGCVFYFALTGRFPFMGQTNAQVLAAHLAHRVIPLDALRPDLPPIVCQWVMSLINLSPADRYQTALEAVHGLQEILAGNLVTVAASAPVSRHPVAYDGNLSPSTEPRTAEAVPVGPALPTHPVRTAESPHSRWVQVFAAAALAVAGSWLVGRLEWKKGPVEQPAAPMVAATPAAAPAPAAASPTPEPVRVAQAATPPPAGPVLATPPPAPAGHVIFRIAGSNTIGASLAPALVEDFLNKAGATGLKRIPGSDPEEMSIEAQVPGQGSPVLVEISAHGSKTAFEGLAAQTCDIGMSSRPVKDEEATACMKAGLGDLRAVASEHVLGLDGIAVIVHPNNPLASLTLPQIVDIFTGATTDWSQLGGNPGRIKVLARDDKSGTFDTFKSLVLGSRILAPDARRFEDSNLLSDQVNTDEQAVGFVGLPYIRSAKALAVSEVGAAALLPTRFTVATEDYPLSRRLFAYTSGASRNPWVRKFVEYATADEGQETVHRIGFVRQTIDLVRPAIAATSPQPYVASITDAERLSLSLRFQTGRAMLDNKAVRDLDRITNLLAAPNLRGRQVLLFGFSDGTGASDQNLKLSKERAQAVAEELQVRGIIPADVKGFGAVLPVASNDNPQGRDKNRRVEVWLR